MNLIQAYDVLLEKDEIVALARGNSMSKYIPDGSLVKIRRFDPGKDTINKGDIVLCKVKGRVYLHLVGAIRKSKGKRLYLIQNAHGYVNGWVTEDKIRGIFVEVVK